MLAENNKNLKKLKVRFQIITITIKFPVSLIGDKYIKSDHIQIKVDIRICEDTDFIDKSRAHRGSLTILQILSNRTGIQLPGSWPPRPLVFLLGY